MYIIHHYQAKVKVKLNLNIKSYPQKNIIIIVEKVYIKGEIFLKKVIIAEKPSVAQNIAKALNINKRQNGYLEGDEYIVTWAFGHLLQLYDAKDYDERLSSWKMENFPIIPDNFKYKIKSNPKIKGKVDKGAKEQLHIIKNLIERKDVVGVIHACDNDREGQIIGDLIINYLNIKKPVERLLLNEWTKAEVLKGMKNLKSNDCFKNMSDAGISRQWADWLIGINLTSVATLKYHPDGVLNIGRVILPTLKIVYDRDKEIENFKKEIYYKLDASFKTNKGEIYKGIYYEKNQDKFKTNNTLKDIEKKLKNNKSFIFNKEITKGCEHPPYLFNLSGLQGYITDKYKGFTAAKVLKIAQSLYEKQYITYPRTASIALDESLVNKAEKVLNVLKVGLPYEKEIKFIKSNRVFDNTKVDGHSAIIPTYVKPNTLTKDEEIIYSEIKDRFIMQFMQDLQYEQTVITTKTDNVIGKFITRGRVITELGFKKVQGLNQNNELLPDVKKGESVCLSKANISTHQTQPPKHHTEKSLLKVMETCGKTYKDKDSNALMDAVLSGFSIGTPATSADTIEKIKHVGYINTKGKNLLVNDLGRSLVEYFPIKELFNLEYTGKLEKTLLDIEKGKVDKNDFLDLIYKFTRESTEKIKRTGGINLSEDVEVLGICPECGNGVVESSKAYGCSNWRNGCKFAIWKNDRYLASMQKKPNKEMVKGLLKDGFVLANGLKSKAGNTFNAILSYKKNEQTGYYNWEMTFPEKDSN